MRRQIIQICFVAWFSSQCVFIAQAQSKPKIAVKSQATDGASRDRDTEAIRKSVQSLVSAFEKGDADLAATTLTEGAELVPPSGDPIVGRDNIRKIYAQHFAKGSGLRIQLTTESLKFISRDTAIEEGQMQISRDQGAATTQRYHLLHIREDGKWLIGLIREWSTDTEELNELAWLLGDWNGDQPEASLRVSYEWFGNKSFIRGTITTRQKDRTLSGMQLIGKDPDTGMLRVWAFEHDGGFAEGTCRRDGESWLLELEGLMSDGEVWSSRNILLRVNNDTLTWQPVNRTIGNDQIDDLPPVKVIRSKPAK